MIDVEWFSDLNKCTTKMRINDTKSNLDISICYWKYRRAITQYR